MKILTSRDHVVELDQPERWDHAATFHNIAGFTIEVEEIHIRHPYDGGDDTAVWLKGRRRLLNGELSIQDPHYVWAKIADIPDARWRELKAAGAL